MAKVWLFDTGNRSVSFLLLNVHFSGQSSTGQGRVKSLEGTKPVTEWYRTRRLNPLFERVNQQMNQQMPAVNPSNSNGYGGI